ncbi:NUDIX hydrolase [Nocardia aurea]|uniref:NUDIX hydrolase n=1 Tax=Nocardia aurea TaxID=2144174 RepID=UPI000D68715A|nr:NUDIX hydrolase [Nocardia aurea]
MIPSGRDGKPSTKVGLSSVPVFESPWLRVRVDEILHADGRKDEFGVVSRSDFVTVICESGGALAMVDQYRYAADRWSLELPQGGVDSGESVVQAALRELREETGWIGTEPEVLGGSFYEAADWATQHFHIVRVMPLRLEAPRLSEDESGSTARSIDLTDLPYLISRGSIIDAATVASIFVYLLVRDGGRPWLF